MIRHNRPIWQQRVRRYVHQILRLNSSRLVPLVRYQYVNTFDHIFKFARTQMQITFQFITSLARDTPLFYLFFLKKKTHQCTGWDTDSCGIRLSFETRVFSKEARREKQLTGREHHATYLVRSSILSNHIILDHHATHIGKQALNVVRCPQQSLMATWHSKQQWTGALARCHHTSSISGTMFSGLLMNFLDMFVVDDSAFCSSVCCDVWSKLCRTRPGRPNCNQCLTVGVWPSLSCRRQRVKSRVEVEVCTTDRYAETWYWLSACWLADNPADRSIDCYSCRLSGWRYFCMKQRTSLCPYGLDRIWAIEDVLHRTVR